MWDQERDDTALFVVVMNDEEQYSIWPKDRQLPLGWRSQGTTGTRAECLARIEEVWTDMRPRSLRLQMEALARDPVTHSDAPTTHAPDDGEDDLVQRLATGNHTVMLSLRPDRSLPVLKDALDRGFVHITFPETQGGTELGIRIDRTLSDVSKADLAAGTGTIRLVGDLTLNFVKVRCIAEIELSSLAGHGRLEILHT